MRYLRMVFESMHNEKNDQYYIEKIKADLLFIVKHMETLGTENQQLINKGFLRREMKRVL